MTLREPGVVELGRERARELAREELSRREYQLDRPGLVERVRERALELLGDLLDRAAGAAPGGWPGLVAVVLLVVAVVVGLRLRLGPLGRAHRAGAGALFAGDARRSADEHRAAADAHAAAGRWDDAVRERVRGLVRGLEERGLLDARPGRTAEQAARAASRALPALGPELAGAARLFDAVAYGDRRARPEHDARLRDLDARVRATRPGAPGGPGGGEGRPRGPVAAVPR
ncbi:DUF4129 domain-containing protein [Vallicoccus soli]|uniref:DUF4129 domain-containing protein n=1 Tax=Vallicoccus soli TaxID=2339232 RepID=A0A3A3YXG2_9ACTN|nr:DUF4129 domain-containing protein [Vallicoccus soli]RJK95403.1 DUF4129 domain-containing protein [Vallicoccus soli]